MHHATEKVDVVHGDGEQLALTVCAPRAEVDHRGVPAAEAMNTLRAWYLLASVVLQVLGVAVATATLT